MGHLLCAKKYLKDIVRGMPPIPKDWYFHPDFADQEPDCSRS